MQETQRREINPWVRKIPWSREWKPTPVFLPEKSHGQRSLAGSSPWSCKESEMTEHTHTHIFYLYIYSSVHSSSFGNISWVYSGETSSATFIILPSHNNWFMYSTWFNHRIRINSGSRLERKVLPNILHLNLGEYGWSYSQWRKCLFEEMDQSWKKNYPNIPMIVLEPWIKDFPL